MRLLLSHLRVAGFLTLSLLALGFLCSKDDDKDADPSPPSLASLWPNDDGRWWLYDIEQHSWARESLMVYPSKEALPPVPVLDELARLIETHAPGDSINVAGGTYEQRFDGETTTESGVTAQNLQETLTPDVPTSTRVGPESWAVLYERLAAARPDLRPALVAKGLLREPGSRPFRVLLQDPLLVHGGAWERTEEWIGTYGDIDIGLAWMFLNAHLAPGNEFTHQLVPSLDDDVFLHAQVQSYVAAETPNGQVENAVRCAYLVDYGSWEVSTVEGHKIGWTQAFDYGYVVYAPGVGPVSSYERVGVPVGDPLPPGLFDLKLVLTDTGMAPD